MVQAAFPQSIATEYATTATRTIAVGVIKQITMCIDLFSYNNVAQSIDVHRNRTVKEPLRDDD